MKVNYAGNTLSKEAETAYGIGTLLTIQFFISPRIYSMLGYENTENWTTLDDWSIRVHPDDLEPIWKSIDDYISGKNPSYQAEFRMRCSDGSYKWLMDRGKIIEWDNTGKPTRLVGVHTDISATKQMVQALQESESQFRLLAERSSDIISRISAAGEILYTSPATEQVLGYTELDLKSRQLIELVHPEDRALVKFVVEHIGEYKEIQPLQYRIKNKSGKFIWVESTAKMVINSLTGEFEEVQLTTRDVSLRVEAETALRESEEKLRALISQSVDGIVLISEEGKVIEWSKGQERMTGVPSAQAIGQYLWKIQFNSLPDEEKTEERKEWIQKQSADFISGGPYAPIKPTPSEWEIQHTDGSKLFIQSTVFPIHTPHGYMGGAISRDITDIKNAELARRKSEERLRFITQNMIDVVCYIDENFIIQYISPSVYGSLGYQPEDIEQKKVAEFIHPDDYAGFFSKVEECKQKQESSFQTEYRILDVGQTYRWLKSLVNLIFDDQNHYTGAVLGSRDISARKIVDDALRASENRYRTLARNFPNGMVMLFDQELCFTVVDGVGLDLFGINREDSEGKTLHEVFPPDLVQELESYFLSSLHGKMEDFELSVGENAIQFYTVPLHDEHGNITGGMMMTQNITDRKDAVVALSSRAQFLSSLNEITRIALETSDTSQLIQHITDLLVLLFEADDCYITRWDAQNQRTIPIAASGSMRDTYKDQVASDDEVTLTNSVLELGRAIVVDDPFNSQFISNSIAKKFRSVSLLGLPLIGGGQKLGAAMIGYNQPHQFDDEEIQKAEQVAGQIAFRIIINRSF